MYIYIYIYIYGKGPISVFLHYGKCLKGCGLVKPQPHETSVEAFANSKYNYVAHIF